MIQIKIQKFKIINIKIQILKIVIYLKVKNIFDSKKNYLKIKKN